MEKKNVLLLILLGAIWGSSFMFMKILAPVFGPVLTASFRLLIGASVLALYFKFKGVKLEIFKNMKLFLFLGPLSLGIPYFLFSVAALYVPSGVSAILNTTAPMFTAILTFFILNEKMKVYNVFGLMVATGGVVMVTSSTITGLNSGAVLGVICVLAASMLYAISGVIIKTKTGHIDSNSLALGNQLSAGLMLLPFVIFYPITGIVDSTAILTLLTFGVFGSGIAMVIYFYLMKQVGPVKTLTVTYLFPFFGLFFGYVFLNEKLSAGFFYGGALILVGIILVNVKGFNFVSKKQVSN